MEYKKQAVELAKSLGSSTRATEQLGIPEGHIYKWKKKLYGSASPTLEQPSNPETMELELKRLRQEIAELKKVNEILKGAAAFFSQDHLK